MNSSSKNTICSPGGYWTKMMAISDSVNWLFFSFPLKQEFLLAFFWKPRMDELNNCYPTLHPNFPSFNYKSFEFLIEFLLFPFSYFLKNYLVGIQQ